ncbi:MAG: hypothetical protein HY843_03015 [Bdellovibrio sp.]|nr:hypothetical protein [Bdellovibrio sp.]
MFNRSFVFITYSLVIAFVCFYLVHSLFLGISDDEAYYWILAQKPSLGFAFHPPLVTWMIALSQKIFSFILPINSVFILRFFSVFCSTFIFALALYWMKIAGVEVRNLWKGALVFLSFAGWSSLCWLMVPDSGLFLGWMLLFVSTWMLCFNTPSTICFVMLVFGSCISLLSKYSGVLSIFSAGFCMFFWCSKENKKKAFLWLGIGTAVAMIPIWIWNHNNNWVSVLYQIQGRHSGTKADFIRYLRFWLVEIFCAGPVLIYYFLVCSHELKITHRSQDIFQFGFFQSRWCFVFSPCGLILKFIGHL